MQVACRLVLVLVVLDALHGDMMSELHVHRDGIGFQEEITAARYKARKTRVTFLVG
jgi:hypothetical protein